MLSLMFPKYVEKKKKEEKTEEDDMMDDSQEQTTQDGGDERKTKEQEEKVEKKEEEKENTEKEGGKDKEKDSKESKKDSDSDDDMVYFHASLYEKSETGFTGLSNQGATCYLNSLVQSMYMTPEIRKKIFQWKYDKDLHGSEERSIPMQLQILFSKLQLTKKKSVSTKKLTKSFGWDSSQSFVQHDVNELCRVLFDALDKTFAPNHHKMSTELKKAATEEEKKEIVEKYGQLIKESNETLISDLFRGEMIDYVLAKDEKDENGEEIGRKRVDKFLDIQLVIRKVHSVEDALKNFIIPEVLGGDNKWFCEDLGKKVEAIKGLKFTSFPPILTLNLKRFDYNPITWTRVKLGHKVSFPFVLDVSPYIDKKAFDEKQCYKYELYSVLIHSGSARIGHYLAFIKTFVDDKWICFNDKKVFEVTEKEVEKMYGEDEEENAVMSKNAYMLMYRRVDMKKPVITDEDVPDYIREKIMKKNKKVEKTMERVEKQKEMVLVRFFSTRHEFVSQIKVNKTITILELTDKIHAKLVRKMPSFGEKVGRDCFRLREWSFYSKGRTYQGKEEKTLKELKFQKIHTCVLEYKKDTEKWKKEVVKLNLFTSPLFPSNDEFNHSVRIKVASDMTLVELRDEVAGMFERSYKSRNRVDFIDPDHIEIYEVLDDEDEKIRTFAHEDDEKQLERDLGFKDNSLVYVELFDKKPRGYQILYDDNFTYQIMYNKLGEKDFCESVKVEKKKTIQDLKDKIAEQLGVKSNEFRMLNYRNYREKFKDMTKVLRDSMLFTGCEVCCEIGKPLEKHEGFIKIYKFTEIGIIEKEEKDFDAQIKELKDEAATKIQKVFRGYLLRKKLKSSDNIADSADVDQEKKEDFKLEENAEKDEKDGMNVGGDDDETEDDEDMMEIDSPEKEIKVEVVKGKAKQEDDEDELFYIDQRRRPTEEEKKGKEIIILKASEDDPKKEEEEEEKRKKEEEKRKKEEEEEEKELTEEEKENRKKIKEILAEESVEKEYTPIQYHYRMKKQFKYLGKIVMSEREKLGEVRKRISEMEDLKGVAPDHIRIRATSYFKLFQILKDNESIMRNIHPYLLKREKKLAVQILDHAEVMTDDDILTSVKKWSSEEWNFIEEFEMIYNKKDGNIKENIAKQLKIDVESFWIHIVPQGSDLKKRFYGFFNWEKSNLARRLYDGVVIVFRLKTDKSKYDVEHLKKHFLTVDPTKERDYVKEEALVIRTEFDEKKEGEKDEKKEKEKGIVIRTEEEDKIEEEKKKYGYQEETVI